MLYRIVGGASVSSIVVSDPTPRSPGVPPSTSVILVLRVPVRKGPIATIPPLLDARTEPPRNNSPFCQRSPAGYSRDYEERGDRPFFTAIRQPRCDKTRTGKKKVGNKNLALGEGWEEDNQTVGNACSKKQEETNRVRLGVKAPEM